jgi:catechol 2,3-dioxygenase-like lactoylglutathione lyase family enzyme
MSIQARLDFGSIPPITSRLDHVALAVRDWESARSYYVDELGASMLIDLPGFNQRITQYQFANGAKLETIAVDENNRRPDGIAAFLERHGETFHHLTLKVPSVPDAMVALSPSGLVFTGVNASGASRHEAYIPVKITGNVPVQLLWLDVDDTTWARRRGFEPQISDAPRTAFTCAVLPHPSPKDVAPMWVALGATVEVLDDGARIACAWSNTELIIVVDAAASTPRVEWK